MLVAVVLMNYLVAPTDGTKMCKSARTQSRTALQIFVASHLAELLNYGYTIQIQMDGLFFSTAPMYNAAARSNKYILMSVKELFEVV